MTSPSWRTTPSATVTSRERSGSRGRPAVGRRYDEGAHRALLRRLLLAGDRASAILASREFSERLRADLGIRPSPPTRAVHAEARAGGAAEPRPRLFGRADEVASLTTAWRAAARGAGQVVVVSGEPGIGKSSLIAELVGRVEATGGRAAGAVGVDVAGQTPFAAWLELSRGLVATAPPVPRQATWPLELNRLSADIGARLGHPGAPPTVMAPELERLRVFESVLRLVEWSCADRPTLLVLDDAHRADRASLRLTGHVGRRLATLPLLLVLAHRDGSPSPELDAMLADLTGRGVPVTHVALGPIDDRALATLASAVHRLDDQALERVIASAEGNPLLAVESHPGTGCRRRGSTSEPADRRTCLAGAAHPRGGGPGALDRRRRATAGPAELAAWTSRTRPRPRTPRPPRGCSRGVPAGWGSGTTCSARRCTPSWATPPGCTTGWPPSSSRGSTPTSPTISPPPAGTAKLPGSWHSRRPRRGRSVPSTRATEFLTRATALDPTSGRLWLELEEARAWSGRVREMESAWERALALLPEDELAAAWCRRGRQHRSVICHPEASRRAYETAQGLLPEDADRQLRVECLLGLAWSDAVAGSGEEFERLLAAGEALLPARPDARTQSDVAEIRMQGLIRRGEFAAAVEIALVAAPQAVAARLPDRAGRS